MRKLRVNKKKKKSHYKNYVNHYKSRLSRTDKIRTRLSSDVSVILNPEEKLVCRPV